ncbi:TauD/TfdA family dioxygenase [Elongatibacter sediminis]|uniref:TauD/TfdA family dioxygenase n=1 Tax=Elongatibacter sediminis TaxID=3119006 RepID=A0AAW9R8P5_9GAMM
MGPVRHRPGPETTPERIRNALDRRAALVLTGFRADTPDALIRTAGLVGRRNTGIDEALLGPAIMHVRCDLNRKADAPAYFTNEYFPLHTDVSYVPRPPRFLLMQCITPDPAKGGACLLADCDEAGSALTDDDLAWLRRPVFNFAYPPGCPEGKAVDYRVRETEFWRYKPGAMTWPNAASAALSRFDAALNDACVTVHLNAGDLLIVDNHRVAHGRTAFMPATAPDRSRHLIRMYAA